MTWKDVVKEALEKTGNYGHLEEINSKIEGHWKTETNPTWKDTVRRTLQQYSIFYQKEKGSGVWYLKEEKPIDEFDPKKNPDSPHENVQGILLVLGRIYGYETSAAINDAKKKFMNILSITVLDVSAYKSKNVKKNLSESGNFASCSIPLCDFRLKHTYLMLK